MRNEPCGNPECDNRATKAVEVAAINYRFFTCADCEPELLARIGLDIYMADPVVVPL